MVGTILITFILINIYKIAIEEYGLLEKQWVFKWSKFKLELVENEHLDIPGADFWL